MAPIDAPGFFVTGTDTGAGKTVVAAAIVAALRARGLSVRALKPLLTGLEEPEAADWPADHRLLASAAGCRAEDVVIASYGPAVSPHLALKLTGAELDPTALLRQIAERCAGAQAVVVEGVGGLLVPITGDFDVRALGRELGLPLVIAARPGLGTINHTLLTLEAARSAQLHVAGVVMTPWPEVPGAIERSNRETVERLGEVEVATLPRLARAAPELLARVGELLPIDRWLASRAVAVR